MKKITVVTDDATALALLGLLVDKKVESVTMERVAGDEPRKRHATKHRLVKTTNTTLHNALSDAFPVGTPFILDQAERELGNIGYARSGASATLSRLQQQGFVRRDGNTFCFLKPVPAGYKLSREISND